MARITVQAHGAPQTYEDDERSTAEIAEAARAFMLAHDDVRWVRIDGGPGDVHLLERRGAAISVQAVADGWGTPDAVCGGGLNPSRGAS